MQVLFLDIDGVLNTAASLAEGVHLLPEKCLLIRRVCEQVPDVQIVISSTWRGGIHIKSMKEMLWRCGIPRDRIIAYTPHTTSGFRGDEINEWILSHLKAQPACEYVKYVIIDDDSDFHEYQKPLQIKTTMSAGLLYRHIQQIIEILNA